MIQNNTRNDDTDTGEIDRRAIANAIDATPNEDLWPLVEEWSEVKYKSNGVRGAYWICAERLEDVIENVDVEGDTSD